MATIAHPPKPGVQPGEPAAASLAEGQPPAASQTWGNTAPLALAAFAVTTLMLSLINAGLFSAATLPVVFGVGFAVGGVTQLIAGLLQFRIGDTFHGVLFSPSARSGSPCTTTCSTTPRKCPRPRPATRSRSC